MFLSTLNLKSCLFCHLEACDLGQVTLPLQLVCTSAKWVNSTYFRMVARELNGITTIQHLVQFLSSQCPPLVAGWDTDQAVISEKLKTRATHIGRDIFCSEAPQGEGSCAPPKYLRTLPSILLLCHVLLYCLQLVKHYPIWGWKVAKEKMEGKQFPFKELSLKLQTSLCSHSIGKN